MGAVLLLAMGYDSLSMSATNLPKVKALIRGVRMEWAKELLADVLQLENAQVSASTLQLALERQGFSRIIGPAL